MLHLLSNWDINSVLILIMASITAICIGYSAVRYIFFSNAKDEINFESDDSIYAFYGASNRPRTGTTKRVSFDM